jgi:hypothetical protein
MCFWKETFKDTAKLVLTVEHQKTSLLADAEICGMWRSDTNMNLTGVPKTQTNNNIVHPELFGHASSNRKERW